MTKNLDGGIIMLEKDVEKEAYYYLLHHGPAFRNLVVRSGGEEFASKVSEEICRIIARADVTTKMETKLSEREKADDSFYLALENLVDSYENQYHQLDINKYDGYKKEKKQFYKQIDKLEEQKNLLNENEKFFDSFADKYIEFIRFSYRKEWIPKFRDKSDMFFSFLKQYLIERGYYKNPSSKQELLNSLEDDKSDGMVMRRGYDFSDFIGDQTLVEGIKKICDSLLLYSPEKKSNILKIPNSLIFSGPPGTGKTFMAKIMRDYLARNSSEVGIGFNYIVIDSTIKNKWYGESEKILKSSFSRVKDPKGIGMIVFDEADSLFGYAHDGSLENSLRGLLLEELEGINNDNYGNFISLFITNNPYSGIESALHSRSREFYFNPFADRKSYSKMIDKEIKDCLNDWLGYDEESKDYSRLAEICLKNKLSGRDVKQGVESYLLDKLLYDFPSSLIKKSYIEKRRFFQDRIKEISEDEMIKYFDGFMNEKKGYEKNEEENRINQMIKRKIIEYISDIQAKEILNKIDNNSEQISE
ncbi:MAG: ATPase family protein 2 [Candidatus Woesearchaeota archaeon]|nr:ATPase family protein 2 [Candidatus Woesearchaeota archaeon]